MPVVRVILREGQEKLYHEAQASMHTPDRTLRIIRNQDCHFQNYPSRFENYLSSLACVRKLDKAPKFLYLDFILSFSPKIWCPRAMIQLSLRTGKNTRVYFTIPMQPLITETSDK